MSSILTNRPSSRRRLLENIFSLYMLQGLNYFIPMAVLPYLIRMLGVEMYGLVAFSQAFAQYFVIFTDYGFNFSATRYIAKHRDSSQDISDMFWQVYILKFGFLVAGMFILGALILMVPRLHHDYPYFLWAYLAVLGNVLFPQWYFQGIEKMKYISACTGIAKILSALALFVWVRHPQDGVLAVIFQSGGVLVAGALGFVIALHEIGGSFVLPAISSLRTTLRDGWHLFVSSAAISLYTNTNLVLVGLIAGNIQAGYFSVAEKIVRAMSGLISPAMQALFPHVNALLVQSHERALEMLTKLLRGVAGFTFLASTFLLLFARPLATLLFGKGTAEASIVVIRLIAFLPFLIGVSNVLGIQTMLPLGFDRPFSRILIISGLVNLAFGIPLIHFLGARGASISVLLTEAYVTLAMVLFLQRKNIHLFRSEFAG
ncbi:flippase [Silvibacterium dinghuense]|uniref:Flippase n=1 Tax=Silvibacterium dinghuense TaxID=1560006 RepID=A0A4Q1SEY9_9BACT|nr:flippase [Silvibacterium dinghuense]RXS95687.1 flippase [Silvibacterium dinghuense]GGH14931.1 transporter [Silvibacterium dinghuense]